MKIKNLRITEKERKEINITNNMEDETEGTVAKMISCYYLIKAPWNQGKLKVISRKSLRTISGKGKLHDRFIKAIIDAADRLGFEIRDYYDFFTLNHKSDIRKH